MRHMTIQPGRPEIFGCFDVSLTQQSPHPTIVFQNRLESPPANIGEGRWNASGFVRMRRHTNRRAGWVVVV
ncbi:protein of unknown function [Aminobacter niigataensis]|nr:protein of unknown function [Aminobacter niigataensis]